MKKNKLKEQIERLTRKNQMLKAELEIVKLANSSNELVNTTTKLREESKHRNKRYPMCKSQDAQLDCRNVECKSHSNGTCRNVSPAITLNENGKYVCWTSKMEL